MKKTAILSIVVLAILSFAATVSISRAEAYYQVCITNDGGQTYYPYAVETEEDEAFVATRDPKPFPDSVVGCAAYNAPSEEPEVCEPVVETVYVTDETKVASLETQLASARERIRRLEERNAAQATQIERLQARLAAAKR